jgi:hypothetical protein
VTAKSRVRLRAAALDRSLAQDQKDRLAHDAFQSLEQIMKSKGTPAIMRIEAARAILAYTTAPARTDANPSRPR